MNLVVIIVAALASSLALIAYRLRQNRTLPGDIPLRTSRLLQAGASPRVADLLAWGSSLCNQSVSSGASGWLTRRQRGDRTFRTCTPTSPFGIAGSLFR